MTAGHQALHPAPHALAVLEEEEEDDDREQQAGEDLEDHGGAGEDALGQVPQVAAHRLAQPVHRPRDLLLRQPEVLTQPLLDLAKAGRDARAQAPELADHP